MEVTLIAFFQAVLSLFAIVDPVGGIPVFISLTQGVTETERRRLLRFATLTALALVVSFALVGSAVMQYVFHIRVSEFTFAGGLLLVVVGIRDMLLGGSPETENAVTDDPGRRRQRLHALAVSPIAVPLLAGPGTIVTVILFKGQYGQLFAVGVCVVVFAFSLLILNYAGWISRVIGRVGMLAVSRVMQIFIIAIGVNFMFRGLAEAFPRLFGR
ncbi:MAG TPA: MarC family protein [Candidatus Glassbacteria bacterium]|nr:MarC family protein [Candidatus Glassbacteria bacterium]